MTWRCYFEKCEVNSCFILVRWPLPSLHWRQFLNILLSLGRLLSRKENRHWERNGMAISLFPQCAVSMLPIFRSGKSRHAPWWGDEHFLFPSKGRSEHLPHMHTSPPVLLPLLQQLKVSPLIEKKVSMKVAAKGPWIFQREKPRDSIKPHMLFCKWRKKQNNKMLRGTMAFSEQNKQIKNKMLLTVTKSPFPFWTSLSWPILFKSPSSLCLLLQKGMEVRGGHLAQRLKEFF